VDCARDDFLPFRSRLKSARDISGGDLLDEMLISCMAALLPAKNIRLRALRRRS